jgi:hypothetical protein
MENLQQLEAELRNDREFEEWLDMVNAQTQEPQ